MDIDLDKIIAWAIDNWFIFAGVVGVILLIWLVLALLPNAKVRTDSAFSTEGPEANDLALGFLQIYNAYGEWNDADGKNMREGKDAKRIREMWGLTSADAARANIERLMTNRRQRPLWQQLLVLRAEAAKQAGRMPSRKQWLAAITAAGGTGKGEERKFVDAVEGYEAGLTKSNRKIFPSTAYVTDFDAYALGQAVAVSTWSVGIGLISREESAQHIRRVNEIARAAYPSWEDFGRAYIVGRAMHWSDGVGNEKQLEDATSALRDMQTALDPKVNGPWALLPWRA